MRVILASVLPALSFAMIAYGQVAAPTFEGQYLRNAPAMDFNVIGLMARSELLAAQKSQTVRPGVLAYAAVAQRMSARGDNNMAWRQAVLMMAAQRQIPAGDALEVAASLELVVDRRIVSPGDLIHARLDPLFTLGRPLKEALTARVELRSVDGKTLAAPKPWTFDELLVHEFTIQAKDLAPGEYHVWYELRAPADRVVVSATRQITVHATARQRIAGARNIVEKLAQLQDLTPRRLSSVETVNYRYQLLQQAANGYVAGMRQDFHPMVFSLLTPEWLFDPTDPIAVDRDLDLVDSWAQQLLAGEDPLSKVTGDMTLAFRAADRSLQPYRVFLPPSYGEKPSPLVVALQGEIRDPSSYVEDSAGSLRRLCQERGYLLVVPQGRGAVSRFQEQGQQDVSEMIERVRTVFAIDPARVFLTGYSTGATAALAIGFKNPEKFAAIAAVAGPGTAAQVSEKGKNLPVRLFLAGKDTLMPPEQARSFVLLASKAMPNFRSVELPDDTHSSIAASTHKAVCDFFDTVTPQAIAKP